MTTLSEEDAARLQEGVAKHEKTTLMAEQAAKVRPALRLTTFALRYSTWPRLLLMNLQSRIGCHPRCNRIQFAECMQTALETRDAARATVGKLHEQELQMHGLQEQYDEVSGV